MRSRCCDFGCWHCDVVYGRSNTMRSNTIQCSAAHSNTIRNNTKQYRKIQYYYARGPTLSNPIQSNPIHPIQDKTLLPNPIRSNAAMRVAGDSMPSNTRKTLLSNPIQSNPIQPNPTQYIIIQSNPIQYIQYNAIHYYPIQSSPILPCASQVTRCHPTHKLVHPTSHPYRRLRAVQCRDTIQYNTIL